MLKRIISAAAYLCVFVPALIFSDTWLLPIEMAIIVAVSVFEMLRCIGVLKKFAVSIPVLIISAAMPIVTRLSVTVEGLYLIPVAFGTTLLLLLYLFGVAVLSNGRFTVDNVATTFMTTVYITAGYCSVIFVRDATVVVGESADNIGKYIFLLAFIGAWVTDTFAYFGGRLLGKHKLCPDISPKKTIEGSISGIIFCVISFLIYGLILDKGFSQQVNYFALAALAVVASVVSQIGDLALSMMKRRYGIKDFGKIMPGHGGFLDRFDSVIPVATVLAVFCELFEALGINIVSKIL